jgi:hypothetical protein
MDKALLEYLRDMALELSALAEEGDFESLSRLFSMAALDAGQRIGPAIAFSQKASQTGGFLAANDDLGHAAAEPAN